MVDQTLKSTEITAEMVTFILLNLTALITIMYIYIVQTLTYEACDVQVNLIVYNF